MPSIKRLSSVCHSAAHHAVSALSYVHPHLGQACDAAGVESSAVDLLAEDIYPSSLPRLEPLALALTALRDRFGAILTSEGFAPSDLHRALLHFEFSPELPDYFCRRCSAVIVATNGKSFMHAVDWLGASVMPNPSLQRTASPTAEL
ncbi:hypothetical protein [Kinneretia aquatilis]|uniref:hypothetical protein n=1 Tax=Kinneretia aquatilis TaxID=2070761 RepID=UPI00105701FE|nr:hypothetical protein [Paucibacter aquatile]